MIEVLFFLEKMLCQIVPLPKCMNTVSINTHTIIVTEMKSHKTSYTKANKCMYKRILRLRHF